MNDSLGLFLGVLSLIALFYSMYLQIREKFDEGGRVVKCPETLNKNARIVSVEPTLAGNKTNRKYRITVTFDDGFIYTDVVKPSTVERKFISTTTTLSREQQIEVTNKAIKLHEESYNRMNKKINNGKTDNVIDQSPNTTQKNNQKRNIFKDQNDIDPQLQFEQKLFPNNCREYVKKQMKSLIGDIGDENEYLKIYIYCMTHYLVNNLDSETICDRLMIAHPVIKDFETAKKITSYTMICAIGDSSKINVNDENTISMMNTFSESTDRLKKIKEGNKEKNSRPYDKEVGIIKEKPMYFDSVKSAESYLQSLMDKEGNTLHIGKRYSYSVDGIEDTLDCYQMLDNNGKEYGNIYLSIYGIDDYKYVPEGYRHQVCKNPEKKEKGIDKTNNKQNKSVSKKKEKEKETGRVYDANSAVLAINEILSDSKVEDNTVEQISRNNMDKQESISNDDSTDYNKVLYCRKCGTKLDVNSIYCRKCGTKIVGGNNGNI